MYEAKRAFKIFSQSAEAAIKGLCASYLWEWNMLDCRVAKCVPFLEFCVAKGNRLARKIWSAIISHYSRERWLNLFWDPRKCSASDHFCNCLIKFHSWDGKLLIKLRSQSSDSEPFIASYIPFFKPSRINRKRQNKYCSAEQRFTSRALAQRCLHCICCEEPYQEILFQPTI